MGRRANPNGRKRKKVSGKHKVPRKPIQMPLDWLKFARELAGKSRQPTVWFLIGLIADEGKRQGVETHPAFPWEAETAAGDQP